MALGVDLLTDDQLVELLIEVCNELAVRDPVVRKAAQNEISQAAKQVKARRIDAERTLAKRETQELDLARTIDQMVRLCREDYLAQLRKEVMAAVQAEIKAGTFQLITPAEEARAIKDATLQANQAALKGVDPAVFNADRRRVMDNLKRMGHSVEDIERLYGKF